MAEKQREAGDSVNGEEYERLVLLTARRRRGEACAELDEQVRTNPAVAEIVETLDCATQELDHQIEATAPSAEHVALQRAALLAEVERMQRGKRLFYRRAAGASALAASLAIAVVVFWQPAVVGRASVTAMLEVNQLREFDIRAGDSVVASPRTKILIELGGGHEFELQPLASVSVYNDRIVVHDGKINGRSGSAEMRIDFSDCSLLLEPGTIFSVRLGDQQCTFSTDREARLARGSGERILTAGEIVTLELGDPSGR